MIDYDNPQEAFHHFKNLLHRPGYLEEYTSGRDDMSLPAGKTCADCAHFERCRWLFGCKPSNTSCDWAPSRFRPAPKGEEKTSG